MWFIQALRIVFHENVPQEILEMSCSWFLGVSEGSVENAECGVRSAGCGKCGVWKMRGVENV